MDGNNKIKPPTGVQINGRRLMLSVYHHGARYRLTTKLSVDPINYKRAEKLLNTLKIDLERGQFFTANYKNEFTNVAILEKLDAHYERRQQSTVLGELLEDQLARYELAFKNDKLSIATFIAYKSIIKAQLKPYFNYVELNQIAHSDLEDFIATLKLSKTRIQSILSPLRTIMRRCKKNGLIKVNPFDNLDGEEISIHSIDSNYIAEPFNTTDKEAIINAAAGQIKNFIQFGFWTGMRIGEIIALNWQDVDLVKEVVQVNKSKSLGTIKTPKTKAGIREVELTPLALAALQEQFKYSGELKKEVFNNPYTNKPWSKPDVFRRYWVKILEEAGVKYRNPHQMRHTFISYMLLKGNRPEVLYKVVGHHNTEMIYRVYGKFIQGENRGKQLKV